MSHAPSVPVDADSRINAASSARSGMTTTMVLRAEGALAFLVATAIFETIGVSWYLYLALFFVPDLAIAGYAFGARIGAAIYNAAHSYVGPALLCAAGLAFGDSLLLGSATIWVAHVGFDRMFGFGLKRVTGFRDTHLGTVDAWRQ